MKKILSLTMLLLVSFACMACGQSNAGTSNTGASKAAADTTASASKGEQAKALVVYFSVTGTTAEIGDKLADILQADKYVVQAAKPYTKEDLNYHNDQTRATVEQRDDKARPAIAGSLPDLSKYDTVYLGYPIWWGQAPKIMYSLVEQCDLSGKKVVPFCVSAQSDIGSSADILQEFAKGKADWKQGKRFAPGASKQELEAWVKTLQ